MAEILIVGATGQAGMAAGKRLVAAGKRVRGLYRSEAAAERLRAAGMEPAAGDLAQPETLALACEGVETVIATANSSTPTHAGDRPATVEGAGYANLLAAAKRAGVRRFVYTSVPHSPHAGESAFFRAKMEAERQILASGLEAVIFRCNVFMDVAFAMMGSDIPVRGAEGATVLRAFGFSRDHFEKIRTSMAEKRTALVPGDGRVRHSFLCVDDVAAYLAAAAQGGTAGTYSVGGPEPLTYLDVVKLFEKLLGHPLQVKQTPAWVFRMIGAVMRPFHPAAANLMQLNYVSAVDETVDDPAVAARFGVRLTRAEEFLRARAAL
jgi:NADH dehydrogenase